MSLENGNYYYMVLVVCRWKKKNSENMAGSKKDYYNFDALILVSNWRIPLEVVSHFFTMHIPHIISDGWNLIIRRSDKNGVYKKCYYCRKEDVIFVLCDECQKC